MTNFWVDRLADAVLGAVLVIGIVCLVNGVRRIDAPFPGFLVATNHVVLSIARPGWSVEQAPHILFSRLLTIEAPRPATAAEIAAAVAALPVGTPVTYRFVKHSEVFTATLAVQRFGLADFVALYVMYFVVGSIFAVCGWWGIRRGAGGFSRAAPFWMVCQTCAIVLLTGTDVYGPYWFTALYFGAHCLAPATLLHFTVSYPDAIGAASRWRRFGLGMLYLAGGGLAVAVTLAVSDPTLLLPLIYVVYLLLANGMVLYLARLLTTWWGGSDTGVRYSIRWALGGLLAAATLPGIIFVIYPALNRIVSPFELIAPLALFPICTAWGLRVLGDTPAAVTTPSIRQRLGILFIGAVETAFLASVGLFWLNQSWQGLIDELTLSQQRQALVETFQASDPPENVAARLDMIEQLSVTPAENDRVEAVRAAITRGESSEVQRTLGELRTYYREVQEHLDERRARLARLDGAFVLTLIGLGLAQATGFMMAIRRWLIEPVGQLATATRVMATGDLGHRVQLDATSEFASLADAVNSMAVSLAGIRARVDAEREARRRAAGAARDSERQRLAHELHDGILQELTAVKLRLETLRKQAPDVPIDPAVDGLIATMANLRRVVDDLGAADLDRASLADAIRTYSQALAAGRGVDLHLMLPQAMPVPNWAARDVYRIVQEGVTNALRHGHPRHLTVRVTEGLDRMAVDIEDDGGGFDPQHVTLGTGMVSMRERAAAIGGSLEVESRVRHGTRIRLILPVPPP